MTISLGQSQNLITNGDFESGDTAWSGAADNLVTDNGNTYFSRTVANAGNPWDANLSRPMSITTPVGTGYTLTFQAWSTTGRTLIAGIGLNGGDYSNVIQTVTLTSTPKRFTLNFNTNFSSESSRIIFDMGAAVGDVNIDNVVLSLTPTNLITNGNFEGGDTGWTGATGNLVTTGDDATYFTTTVANAGNAWEVNLSRPVSITAAVGTSYQLSFQAWSNTGRTILAGIGLAGDPWTNQVQTVTLTSTPQTFFLDLTTNFSSASSRIIFDMGAAAGDVNIDNVVLSSAVATSTCNNGVQDGDETGVDCGGTCPACPEVVNIEGKWKVTELGVGPAKGSYAYFSVNASSGDRSCFFDDVYQFNADASFNFIPGSQTYNEGWLGTGCGAAVAPFDGSNAATYTNSGSAITVTGTGAYIGLPKAINGAEISSTEAHPGTVTYQSSVTTTEMTLDINVGGNWWRYKLAKVDESLPIITDFPALEKALTAQPFDLVTPTSNSAGAFTYTSSNEAVATISGSTVTIVGPGTTTITATQAANGTFNTGSISAQLVVAYPAPAVAATTPTRAAEDVISIFSGAYTDKVGTAFAPNWGQNPTYAQVNIDGNATNRYTNFSFVGNTFGAGGVDASAMQQLHLDIWTPDCTSFDVYVLDGSDEQKVTLTPTTSEWNSFDIDLSQYTLLTKSSIVEFKFANGGSGTKTIYLDNIYFWKTPSGFSNYYVDADSDGYGAGTVTVSATPIEGSVTNNTDCNDTNAAINPGATEIADGVDNDCDGKIDEGFPPSTAAPAPPARNPWDVKSIFSGAYSNVTLNELPTSWSESTFEATTIASNATWKMDGAFLGMVTNYDNGVDLSQMTTMHIDYWTPDNNPIGIKLVNTQTGQDPLGSLGTTVTGSWQSVDIDLSTYGGLDRSKIMQILIDPNGASTIFIDNFYFYRAATGSTYYADADGDGYGAGTTVTLEPSTAPVGYSATNGDCDDTKASVNPGATEIFDTIDNDCDGVIDEGTTLGAPVVANTGICKGTVGATPSATALPGYTLVWYTAATGTAAPLAATPVITATKTFYVAQRLGTTGPISPRASVTVTVNTLPATIATLTTSDDILCKHIGTENEVTYTAASGASSYVWTVPTGVSIVGGQGTNALTVNFSTATLGFVGTLGAIGVKAVDANSCISATAKTITLKTKLPVAPTSLKLSSTGLGEDIKKVGPYMGTETVFTLTAPAAATAASYSWTLPNGVNQLDGGNSNVITVDFYNVGEGIGSLPIVVKSKGGCGESTAKTLNLARVLPAKPSVLVLNDDAISDVTAVTKVGPYTGKETPLTLRATPASTLGATATSFKWVLPEGVIVTSGALTNDLELDGIGTRTVTSTSSALTVNLFGIQTTVLSIPVSIYAVNGAGISLAKTITLTAAVPATPAIVGSGGNGTATQFGICSTKTYTATSIPGATYTWTVPAGAQIVGATNGYVIEVNYSATSVALNATSTVTCSATNGTGTSGVKSLTVKRVACTGARLAPEAATTEKFSAMAYPNPSTEGFRVKSSNGKSFGVQVYDMLGRSIEQRQMSSDAQIGSNYAKGIYNVIVNQGANVKTLRVIKK